MSEPFEWRGFRDPRARRRRWEQDGYLGDDDSMLVVADAAGTFMGIVVWSLLRSHPGPRGCLEIGILLAPEHRGRGVGTEAQRAAGRVPLRDHCRAPLGGDHRGRQRRGATSVGEGRVHPRRAPSWCAASCGAPGETVHVRPAAERLAGPGSEVGLRIRHSGEVDEASVDLVAVAPRARHRRCPGEELDRAPLVPGRRATRADLTWRGSRRRRARSCSIVRARRSSRLYLRRK